jgi:hypothetical protein
VDQLEGFQLMVVESYSIHHLMEGLMVLLDYVMVLKVMLDYVMVLMV